MAGGTGMGRLRGNLAGMMGLGSGEWGLGASLWGGVLGAPMGA